MKSSSWIVGLAAAPTVWSLAPLGQRAPGGLEAIEGISQIEENLKEKRQTGPAGLPFTTFNKNQLVDVTGVHKWVAPGPNDIRGPCPGLNALANHGYFPHNGVVPLLQAATATNEVYGQHLGTSNSSWAWR